ncbi:porin [uncultured Aquimonas sp.]|uniref:porin n=1 Tax=uncultured Aquimonas sp. TaxID=385483 RepID=UPI002613DAC6|nr:porin [uncultured Aquimonas sp.]
MKRNLIALAVLAAVGAPAAAQSSVTLYGLIGLEVGKNPGSDNKVVQNGANSRLGVRGVEDLGGGMRAFFTLENRYEPDTGTQSDAGRFWNGRSIVGLEGAFGRVWMGREYTPLFLNVALIGDPWGWTGIGALDSGLGGIGAYTRYDNSVNYQFSAGGMTAWIQTAERDNNGNSAGTAVAQKRPMSLALTYGAGPFFAGVGYDSRINNNDSLLTLVSTYNFGVVKLFGTYARGETATAAKHQEIALAATAQLGMGQLRVGVDQIKRTSAPATTLKQQVALGYHYSLSKRTTVFADVTNDSKALRSKSGYGFGVKHAF